MEKDKEFTVARLILRMANQIVKTATSTSRPWA